jgi:hypothetical protein
MVGTCWQWPRSKNNKGYGSLTRNGRTQGAHRFSYELFVGPIPDDHDLHHECGNRACVNPWHMKPKLHRDNLLGDKNTLPGRQVLRTHCPQGHPYDSENTYIWRGKRRCRICNREIQRARYRAQKG